MSMCVSKNLTGTEKEGLVRHNLFKGRNEPVFIVNKLQSDTAFCSGF